MEEMVALFLPFLVFIAYLRSQQECLKIKINYWCPLKLPLSRARMCVCVF